MGLRSELEKTKKYLRKARKAIRSRGGEISLTAGLKDLTQSILNIPSDASIAFFDDDSIAYKKVVPENVEAYARIKRIGGMSYKSRNLLPELTLEAGEFDYSDEDVGYACNGNIEISEDGTIHITGRISGTEHAFNLIEDTRVELADYVIGEIESNNSEADAYLRCYDSVTEDRNIIVDSKRTLNTGVLQLDLVISNYEYVGKTFDVTFKPYIYKADDVPTVYEAPGFIDTKCTAIISNGVNLYNGEQNIVITEADYNKSKTVFESNIDETVTFSYTLNGTAANKATLFQITLLDGTTANIGVEPTVITVRSIKKIQMVNWCKFNGTIENIQIQYGNKTTEFFPYREPIVFPIPNDIITRDDYGIGIDAEHYNYIEWRDGRCYSYECIKKTTEPNVLSVNRHDNGQAFASIAAINPKPNGAVLTQNYTRTSWSDKDKYIYIIGGTIIINDSRFSSVDVAKGILATEKPIIYYELATPTETDITHLFTKDNHIEVVRGGDVTADNDGAGAVPTTLRYTMKIGG